MQQERYLPLKIARETERKNDAFTLLEKGGLVKSDREYINGYLEHVLGEDFMSPAYKGSYSAVDNLVKSPAFLRKVDWILKNGGGAVDVFTEIHDFVTIGPVIRLWSTNKKVYKIDATFYKELIKTENIVINPDAFKYLPHRVLYIDLEDCDGAGLIQGAFVYSYYCNKFPEAGWQIIALMVTKDRAIFSYNSHFNFKDGSYDFMTESKPNTDLEVVNEDENGHLYIEKMSGGDNRTDVVKAVIQILMFLSSPEPDLKEITNKTYKPYRDYRNVYSERLQDLISEPHTGRDIMWVREELRSARTGCLLHLFLGTGIYP